MCRRTRSANAAPSRWASQRASRSLSVGSPITPSCPVDRSADNPRTYGKARASGSMVKAWPPLALEPSLVLGILPGGDLVNLGGSVSDGGLGVGVAAGVQVAGRCGVHLGD